MKTKIIRQERYFKLLRAFTRLISILIGVYVILLLVGGLFNLKGSFNWEGFGVAVFGVLMVASIAFAMIKERIGGFTMIILGFFFAVFIYITAGTHRIIAAIGISAGFWLPGVLFTILKDKYREKHL